MEVCQLRAESEWFTSFPSVPPAFEVGFYAVNNDLFLNSLKTFSFFFKFRKLESKLPEVNQILSVF